MKYIFLKSSQSLSQFLFRNRGIDSDLSDSIEDYTGKIVFHREKSFVASTIGHIRNLVSAVVLADPKRILNGFSKNEQDEIESKIRERYKNIHFMDDLHIYFGSSGFKDQIIKYYESQNQKVPFWEKIKLSIEDFFINSSRSDHYVPGTNTITLYSDQYSTAAHEIGHAIDFNAYEGKELTRTSSQQKKGWTETLNKERIASNFAMRFMTPEERKKYSGNLSAAYGTYQGGTVGVSLSLPVWMTGFVIGNPLVELSSYFLPFIGAMSGAWGQKFRNFFRSDSSSKNTVLDIDRSQNIDTNPYWDGMFESNTVSEKEALPVKGVAYI